MSIAQPVSIGIKVVMVNAIYRNTVNRLLELCVLLEAMDELDDFLSSLAKARLGIFRPPILRLGDFTSELFPRLIGKLDSI